MACRINLATFYQMAQEEAAGRIGIGVDESPSAALMAELVGGDLILHKKPIQALVDTAEEARPIIRNLIRWAVEERDKSMAPASGYGFMPAIPWWRRFWRTKPKS